MANAKEGKKELIFINLQVQLQTSHIREVRAHSDIHTDKLFYTSETYAIEKLHNGTQ